MIYSLKKELNKLRREKEENEEKENDLRNEEESDDERTNKISKKKTKSGKITSSRMGLLKKK